MNNNLKGKYFVRRKTNASWEDITTKFDGVKVLSIEGFNEIGDAVNVYTEQWIDEQAEDFLVVTQDNGGNDVIIRQNVDLRMTFIVSRRYAANVIDEETVYNTVVDYFTKHGGLYIKSVYPNKVAHVVCLKGFAPTTEKLHRGERSYILTTITLHCLDEPTNV